MPLVETYFHVIIHSPIQTRQQGLVKISVQVEMHATKSTSVRTLWFQFPEDSHPNQEIDPFAVALLLVAMQENEPLELKGTLSQKLFTGLNAYQRIFHSWFPGRFHMIELRPSGLRNDLPNRQAGQATAFSGGVDSFYTLLKLREGLTHAVFMAGFDMPLNLSESIGALTDSYSRLMKDLGLTFIVGSTNVRTFVNSVDWTNAHGPALGATALFFKQSLERFYIPSSYERATYPRWGTHPELDPLLSTESLSFEHHGSDANRVKKLETVTQAPETYERLRVCWIQTLGLKNCGECEKCLRTMIALDLLEMLPNYKTFKPAALTSEKIRALPLRTHQSRVFARELLSESFRRRRWDRCRDLGQALLKREWNFRVGSGSTRVEK